MTTTRGDPPTERFVCHCRLSRTRGSTRLDTEPSTECRARGVNAVNSILSTHGHPHRFTVPSSPPDTKISPPRNDARART